ncbi:MAG: ABC transporter permease subunit [Verrucomicrobia bacterium]|nr:ABC transporter permease subunit [Verrucomicrobiota bacterium]
MNILPIVERELLVRARQGRTQWTRLGVSAVGVFLSLQFLALWGGASVNLAQLSGFAFQALAWIGFLLGCAGCLVTADCLSGERREGTLGLLLLTRVGVGEVVLGKLASNGLAAVFGLVALTPTLMLPVLAGGVTWRQVMWTAGSWLAMLWFSLCLGLWASGGGWAKAKSLKRAAAGFGLFVFLPWLLGSLQLRAGVSERGRAILCLSPATAFLEAAVSGTNSSGLVVIGSCAASVGLGMGFLYQARR